MSAIPESTISWMNKASWGPLKWRELHLRSLSYLPMKDEQKWFDSFVNSIPCPSCQKHFELFIKDHPPDFSSRPAFFRWTVNAHNYVNRSKGGRQLTIDEVLDLYKEIWY